MVVQGSVRASVVRGVVCSRGSEQTAAECLSSRTEFSVPSPTSGRVCPRGPGRGDAAVPEPLRER